MFLSIIRMSEKTSEFNSGEYVTNEKGGVNNAAV